MDKPACCYVSIVVRFHDDHLSPVQRLDQMKALIQSIQMLHEFGEIDVEIGEHTGGCSPAYCDQVEAGWH